MEFGQVYYCVALLIVGSQASPTGSNYFGKDDVVSHQTETIYNAGVHMGIVNSDKYSLESFERDERNIFKDLYKEYISFNGSQPINYQEWLIMNNFGIFPDTQESLFQTEIRKRSTADTKSDFVNTVKKGDILITGKLSRRDMNIMGNNLLGHAAIMATDEWVLEMPGGEGWEHGTFEDNNRKITKDEWFDLHHASDKITVYRCPDDSVAIQAADWAYQNYYNPSGGDTKTIHITYKITTDIMMTNPSYCSKLVTQAYYFGTGSKKVIGDLSKYGPEIAPVLIPTYFLPPYTLVKIGSY